MVFRGRTSTSNAGMLRGEMRGFTFPPTAPDINAALAHGEILMPKRMEIASRLSAMLNEAFSKTFVGVEGHRIYINCPPTIKAFQFLLREETDCLDCSAPDKLPGLRTFPPSRAFLGNVSLLEGKHGFARLRDLYFLDLKNNSTMVEIIDAVEFRLCYGGTRNPNPASALRWNPGALRMFRFS